MHSKNPAVLHEVKPVFLLSVEVRQLLRCSKRTLLRMIHGYNREDGSRVRAVLPFIRRGSRLLFTKAAIDAYITKRTVSA
jgi:Helix-turn-helix domain